jgi:TonB family protein
VRPGRRGPLGAGLALVLAAATTVRGAAPVGTAAAEKPNPDPAAAVESTRRAQIDFFRDDAFSPLRAVRRFDFPDPAGEGAASAAVLGSAPDADLRLDAPGIPPRLLRLTTLPPEKEGDPCRFRLERLAGKDDLRIAGETFEETERVVVEETRLEAGPFALRPYVQADRGIVIVFDSRRTSGAGFVAPAFFPYDARWSFRLPLHRHEHPGTITLATSLGRSKEYRRAGWFDVPAPGGSAARTIQVQAYQPLFVAQRDESLSILFTDATTGRESYATGRYMDLAAPSGGLYQVDFNRAYNPLCAYTTVYNCPIPPRENALPLPVRAGEKAYPGHATKDHAAAAPPGAPLLAERRRDPGPVVTAREDPARTGAAAPAAPPPGDLFASGLRDFLDWAHPADDGCTTIDRIEIVSRFTGGLRARYEVSCGSERRLLEGILSTREAPGVWQVAAGFEAEEKDVTDAIKSHLLRIPKEPLEGPGPPPPRVKGPSALQPPPDNPGPAGPLDAVAPPVPVRESPPAFPEEAGRARLIGEARVELLVDISPKGEPRRARTLRGPDPDLGMRTAANAAVRGWRFRPATLGGRAVRYFAPVEITFTGLPPESRAWSHRALYELQALSFDQASSAAGGIGRLRSGASIEDVSPESALDADWGLVPAAELPGALRQALHEARVGDWTGPVAADGRQYVLRKSGEVYYAILPPGTGPEVQYQIVHQRGVAEGEPLKQAIDADVADFMAERHRRDYMNEAARLMGIRQARVEVGQLVIHTDALNADETAVLGQVVNAAVRAHQEFWANLTTLRLFRQPVYVYAFGRRGDHVRVQQLWRGRRSAGAATAVGEYLPASRILAFPCEPTGGHVPIPIVVHEAIHMLDYERVYPPRAQPSKWFEEGLANYFGFSRLDGDMHVDAGSIRSSASIVIGSARVQFDPRAELREHLRLTRVEGPMPLEPLLAAGPDDELWAGGRSARAYGAAWTLIHFLRHSDRGRREAAFEQYAAREAAGHGGLAAFKEIFGPDLAALETAWHDYEATL